MSRAASACCAASALVLALCAPASAATVRAERTPANKAADDTLVSFVAEPGEANRLAVTLTASEVTFEDRAAELSAGTGCTGAGPRVSCPVVSGAAHVSVGLGDGDDEGAVWGRLDRAWSYVRIAGGDGTDLLSATGTRGVVFSSLDGGQGDDRLVGARTATSRAGRTTICSRAARPGPSSTPVRGGTA